MVFDREKYARDAQATLAAVCQWQREHPAEQPKLSKGLVDSVSLDRALTAYPECFENEAGRKLARYVA